MAKGHVPVLLKEVLTGLDLRPGMVIVDGTLGLGGHAHEIALKIGPNGTLIGFDRDQKNLAIAQEFLANTTVQKFFIHDSFDNLASQLHAHHFSVVHGVLLDLGLSSPHVDQAERGFSFSKEGPLDMRFDQKEDTSTAADLVNTCPASALTRIFWQYGEEKRARRIAQAIVLSRKKHPFLSTVDLVRVIESVVPRTSHMVHPATRVFQALRIAVNRELDALTTVLQQALDVLIPAGRLVVISYHSLEDRIVKDFFRNAARACVCPPEILRCVCGGHAQKLRTITKKPIVPSAQEIAGNPRSRSAKLRIAEKL